MKPIHTVLAVCGIVLLFVAWNSRYLFRSGSKRGKSVKKMDKLKMAAKKRPVEISESDNQEEDESGMILKEVLELNRAAHVLTRSGALLDKLLKQDKTVVCGTLIRDYDLSSVMVLIKREEEVEEGFKRIKDESTKGASFKGVKEMSISKSPGQENVNRESPQVSSEVTNSHSYSQKANDHDNHDTHDNHDHHSTSDPLRIALYCRNAGRQPRVGRVIRMVESSVDHGEKYIIELVK